MKTLVFLLLTIMMCIGCTKEPTDSGNVKISIDYALTPRSADMATKGASISDEYQAFFTKYIASRRLTPAKYVLNFEGVNHHFKTQSIGKWANKDLITLPEDTYIVSGGSYPKIFQASGDTCYLAIQDTIIVNATSTSFILKATYDCYLLLFDNSNVALYSITESPQSDESQVTGVHCPYMMKTENFYHIFCRQNNITLDIELLDHLTSSTYVFSNYKFDIGKYYYFEYVNGSYSLQPMINASN
jgi:hypothetical protein